MILGGSGSGKTTLIEEKIKKDIEGGRQVILLVPEQETVSAERRMLSFLPPSAQLSFEVLNFTRLANRVFRQYGGLARRNISAGVRSLSMWNTVRSLRPLLCKYGGGENSDLALTSLMLATVEEFEAYCVSPERLELAANELDEKSTLRGKLRDLSLIYAAYKASLETYGDGDDELSALDGILSEHDFFKQMNVYIDSFTDFTEQEHKIICRMIDGASSVTATVCYSDEKPLPMHFETMKGTVDFFLKQAEKRRIMPEITWLYGNKRSDSEALKMLERDLDRKSVV